MIRAVVGFHLDPEGALVAELACWHNQHVRPQPPFQDRAWVLDPAERADNIGSLIDCPLCERAELPDGLVVLDRAGPWDDVSLPEALRHTHRTPPHRWGNLKVHEGAADFQFRPDETPPGPIRHLRAGSHQSIPPDLAHRVIPTGPVRLELEFWGRRAGQFPHQPGAVASREKELHALRPTPQEPNEGGDPACWAALLCPDCGVVLHAGPHRPNCPTPGYA